MSGSIIDSLSSLITPQIVGSLASRLGESENAVQKGLTGGAATLLSAIAGRAGDTSFLSGILGLLSGAGTSANLLGSLAGLASGGANASVTDLGSKFLGMVLGGNQGGIADAVARASGLKPSSAGGILSMAAPLVLGLLGQRVSSGGLNAAGLGSLLANEGASLQQFLPAGIGSLLGGIPRMAAAAVPEIPAAPAASGSGWMVPAVIGALLLGGLFWFLNQGREPAKEVAHEAPKVELPKVEAPAALANPLWAALGDLFKRKLPGGIELSLPKLGVENRLVDFIEDATKPVDKTTWFDFDRLLFDTAKATLRPESQEQLENVAQILKAFPNVNLKIGGYTDNVGNKASNLKLSGDRASSVMGELVKLGIDKARLEAEGYGDQHPVADNATEEGRQKNRRVSMRVTKK